MKAIHLFSEAHFEIIGSGHDIRSMKTVNKKRVVFENFSRS